MNMNRPRINPRTTAGLIPLAAICFLSANAHAEADDAPADPESQVTAPSLPGEEEETPADASQTLEDRMEELEVRLKQSENEIAPPSRLSINGYVDFGFFVPMGNGGVGWQRDVGNEQFPQHSNYAWTFVGDILATQINSRGEVADLGDGPGVNRFDSVNSNGAPGFLVNEVNLRLGYQLNDEAIIRTSLNLIPRTGNDFSLGDFFDLDIAELEYVLTEDGNTSFFIGKTLPVFGIEYKERKSDQRFGIVPSLIDRYTSGTQLGIKARTKLFDEWLILAASVSNGSSSTEQFHFFSEVDQNSGKTLNGRAALHVPIGKLIAVLDGDSLEIGGSGEWGPQDRATDNQGSSWFAGVDLTYSSADFSIKAQWMRGKAPGRADEEVWSLRLNDSGYVELDWMFLPYLGVIARGELRDAVVTLAAERIYVTKSWRGVGGLRAVFNPHVTLKVEYLYNGEFGDIRAFDDDIFTSSLVLSY
jgi:hypothetical protein